MATETKSLKRRAAYAERLADAAVVAASEARGRGSWRAALPDIQRAWAGAAWQQSIPRTSHSWRVFRRLVREALGLPIHRPRQMRLPLD